MNRKTCENAESSSSIKKQSTDTCWILKNLEATYALGKSLHTKIPDLKLLLLEGPLGAGKTSLVKGLALSLKIHEPITSPTFSIANHYPEGIPPLIHIDLYRIEDPHSADQLFLQEEEEAHSIGALLVVEWPERLGIVLNEGWRLQLSHRSQGGRFAQLKSPFTELRNDWTS